MDENADGGTVVSVATANSTSVTVDDERFEIADGNLKLKDGMSLDFESDTSPIDVTITASGDGASATATVSVSVTDVNEGPSLEVADGAVDENAAGAMVGAVTVSDPDADDTHTYVVSDERFEVADGMLKLKDGMSLDHETEDSVAVNVTVTDAGGLSASADAAVAVNNVNEGPSLEVADGAVDENAAGAMVGAVTASDPDADDTYTYSVSDERFEVADGMLKLKDGMSLDHETEDSVTVTVTVTDAGGLSASADAAVSVNNVNEGPSLEVADGAVDENAAGAMVGAVTVSDPDADDTHTYVVSDERFEVADGMLKLKDGMSLDHETEDSVAVNVTVTDAGGLSASADVAVSVTDVNEAPTVTITPGAVIPVKEVTSNSTVAENAMGSAVPPLALIEVTDPDDADSDMLTGALALGATTLSGDGADNFEVILDPLNGLWLALKAGASLDYETTGGSVVVTVTYTDTGGNAVSADATVTVTDANDAPVFAASDYAFDLNENADGSTTAVALGMVSATDEDAGATQAFSITAGNDDDLFAIDSATGAVTYVGTGENYRSLATGAAHTLTVSVSDGTASAEATVAVTVLNVNEAPVFGESAYAFDLGENQDGSTDAVAVGKVSAADPDEGDPITYSITSGNDAGMFAIDHYGNITYTGTGEDAESATTSYELMVNASDGGVSSDTMVTVSVTDADDNTPEFMFDEGTTFYTFNLAENTDGSETAAAVGSVSATDADGDMITYSIVDGNDDGLFAIDAATGAITYVGAGENFESETTSHELTVQANDADDGVRARVAVNVEDVNEGADVTGEIADFVFLGGQEGSMELDLKAMFSDPDGDGLNYRLSDNAPEWLEFKVTLKGTGEDQTITGTIYGTPPAVTDMSVDDVAVIASDGKGAEGHAMFDVIVDVANATPSLLELRVTDADGLVIRTSEVKVAENEDGAVIGMLTLADPDDARHPHGQHTYTFEVDGEADDRFEVNADGYLKLKDDQSLNYEVEDEIALTVIATDMTVGEPEEDEDDTTESISIVVTIDVTNVAVGDGPVAHDVKDAWVTVDEDLDEDDVDEGDWLDMALPEQDDDDGGPAFVDEDDDELSYSLGAGAPEWLQINEETGRLTNKEEMLPDRGVYDVTVIATDEAEPGNTAETSFKLAVAISDSGDEDNDQPDIRNIGEFDYTEGDEDGGRVASFEVRDEDIEIAPHPYGVLEVEFTAMQEGDDGTEMDVTDAFKVVRVNDDGDDTANYEIHAKSAAELAEGTKDADGEVILDDDDEVIPVKPIDYENGDEINFEIMAEDGADGEDDRGITIDVEDAPDESPEFQKSAVAGGIRDDDEETTTVSVLQEQARTVMVLQLSELWEDADTDDDDLDFDVSVPSDLPDWIKVYGPDRWEDIYEDDDHGLARADGPSDVRDRDQVVVIVMDRSAADGEVVSLDGGSFTISAEDEEGNSSTETIMLSVTNTNVDPADATMVVSISGGDPNDDDEVTGTGNLTMTFNRDMDPDLEGGEHPYLVLYTWMVSTDTADTDPSDGDESVTTIMVSASAQPLMLGVRQTDGTMTRNEDYVDQTITAKVEVFEVDPQTGKITMAQDYTATVDTASAADAPVTPPAATSVTFGDLLTDTTGLSVSISATGDAAASDGSARLQASTDGSSGWITVDTTAANTDGEAAAAVTLDVDANGDGTTIEGDGGGLYYRVVYVYEDEDGDDVEEASDVIQLGSVATDPTAAATGLIAPTAPASGETVRVDTGTDTVEVQWQVETMPEVWMDLAGETGKELSLTDDQAGMSVRAKVTYMGDDDNPDHVTWVEYSAEADVAALTTAANNAPARTQAAYEIRVNLNSDDDEGTGTGSVAGRFFDADGDDLTYTLVGDQADDGAGGVQPGGTVYRSEEEDQILTINSDTGNITYYTSNGTTHDDDTTNDPDGDGAGNIFTVMVQATDDAMPAATSGDDLTVNVRVNVAPTAIHLNGNALQSDAEMPATVSEQSFDETAEHAGGNLVTLDVQDLNLNTDLFGTHDLAVDDSRFEVARVDGTDMSMWTLSVKEDAEFDFEHEDNPMGVVTVKVTATDKGGKKTEGYISFQINDVGGDNDDSVDPQYEAPATTGAGSGGIAMGSSTADDDDGQGNAPGDGGAFIDVDDVHVLNIETDDLLDSYVLAIDDIDVA